MFLKFLKINFLIIFLSSISLAEVVNNIEIKGNIRISEETIKVLGDISIGQNLNENDAYVAIITKNKRQIEKVTAQINILRNMGTNIDQVPALIIAPKELSPININEIPKIIPK